MKHYFQVLICSLALFAPSVASAHSFAPVSIQLVESAGHRVELTIRSSASTEMATREELILPQGCNAAGPAAVTRAETETVVRASYLCAESLSNQRVHLDEGTDTRRHIVLTALLADGTAIQRILVRGESSFLLASTESHSDGTPSVRSELHPFSYLWIGVEHIWFGFDHLLFVLCLVLLIRSRGRLFWTITAFTVAHSVTLGLAALGVVRVPGPPVEATIALSIVLLAVEAVRSEAGVESLTSRLPWLVSLLFGLIHGLGFAGALADIGLPESQEIAALASFNIGVELGQIAFVVVMLVVGSLAERFAVQMKRPARVAAAWISGCIASYWLFERVAGFYLG